MIQFRKMAFKMKVSYECWKQKKILVKNLKDSLHKTADENLRMTSRKLQSFIMNEDGVPFYCQGNKISPRTFLVQAYLPQENLIETIARILAKLQQGMKY